MRRILTIALLAGSLLVVPSPTHAISSCVVSTNATYGYSRCDSTAGYGNFQRLRLKCVQGFVTWWLSGDWVPVGVRSERTCPSGFFVRVGSYVETKA